MWCNLESMLIQIYSKHLWKPFCNTRLGSRRICKTGGIVFGLIVVWRATASRWSTFARLFQHKLYIWIGRRVRWPISRVSWPTRYSLLSCRHWVWYPVVQSVSFYRLVPPFQAIEESVECSSRSILKQSALWLKGLARRSELYWKAQQRIRQRRPRVCRLQAIWIVLICTFSTPQYHIRRIWTYPCS